MWQNEVPETIDSHGGQRGPLPYFEAKDGYWWCIPCKAWLQNEDIVRPHVAQRAGGIHVYIFVYMFHAVSPSNVYTYT